MNTIVSSMMMVASSSIFTTIGGVDAQPLPLNETQVEQYQDYQNMQPLKVGDNICVEGYVMDLYCIDRGTLLDAPDVVALKNPELHSFFCLIEPPPCAASPWNVLIDPAVDGDGFYRRGFVLDEVSKQNALSLARSVGSCPSCDNGTNDQDRQAGFRVVMNSTILHLNEDDKDTPPLLHVHDMQDIASSIDTMGGAKACLFYYGMEDIVTKTSSSPTVLQAVVVDHPRSKLSKMVVAHGALMLIGWGLFLPSGVIIGKFLKHRPNGLWFQIHRALQSFGMVLTLIGWIIALSQFDVFGVNNMGTNYQHGILGIVVMVLGILQPINAFFRPKLAVEGEETSTGRKIWEIYHKGAGWLCLLLAIATIVLGTKILPYLTDQKNFQIAYGVCWILVLLLIGLIFLDKKTYKFEGKEEETKKSLSSKDDAANVNAEVTA